MDELLKMKMKKIIDKAEKLNHLHIISFHRIGNYSKMMLRKMDSMDTW